MIRPILLHIGEDYAKIVVNGFEYEIGLSLMKNLYLIDNLKLSDDIDKKELDTFIKEI